MQHARRLSMKHSEEFVQSADQVRVQPVRQRLRLRRVVQPVHQDAHGFLVLAQALMQRCLHPGDLPLPVSTRLAARALLLLMQMLVLLHLLLQRLRVNVLRRLQQPQQLVRRHVRAGACRLACCRCSIWRRAPARCLSCSCAVEQLRQVQLCEALVKVRGVGGAGRQRGFQIRDCDGRIGGAEGGEGALRLEARPVLQQEVERALGICLQRVSFLRGSDTNSTTWIIDAQIDIKILHALSRGRNPEVFMRSRQTRSPLQRACSSQAVRWCSASAVISSDSGSFCSSSMARHALGRPVKPTERPWGFGSRGSAAAAPCVPSCCSSCSAACHCCRLS